MAHELWFRLGQAHDTVQWKFSRGSMAVREQVSHGTVAMRYRISHSSLLLREHISYFLQRLHDQSSLVGEKYHSLVAVLKEATQRVLESLKDRACASPFVLRAMDKAREMAYIAMARTSPLLAELARRGSQWGQRGGLPLLSATFLLGFIGGRLWTTKPARLQHHYMRGAVCVNYTGIEGVAFDRMVVPRVVSDNQVLVRVMAVSLDLSDVMAASGWGRWERRRGSSGGFTLGRDLSGVVVEVGVAVTHLHPGDKVWAVVPYTQPGTMAELVVLEGTKVEKLPPSLSFEGGATVPHSALQVWGALVWRGGLTPDHCAGLSVLIVDGVSPTGCLAVQLAALWGATVTTIAPYRVVPLAHALGAHAVVAAPQDQEDISLCRAELQQAGPYDLIVTTSSLLPQDFCLSLLAPHGRLTSSLPPYLASDGWGALRRWLLPSWRRLFSAPSVPRASQVLAPLKYMSRVVTEGRLQPVLDTVYTTNRLQEGLLKAQGEETIGKSVIVFS